MPSPALRRIPSGGTSMNPQPPRITPHAGGVPVWPDLPDDLQRRAVRLLAQLAYAQHRQTAHQPAPERNNDHPAQQSQDPARSS
jgi:hypothetical protein